MEHMYKYWNSDEALAKYYAPRVWDQRFRSEKYFLEKIIKKNMRVLDVGCATGDLYLGLCEKYDALSYVGIDVAENLLERGRTVAPNAMFIKKNILHDELPQEHREFDLVTATGVCQHEKEYKTLIKKMISYSSQYVLFDVKLFHSTLTLCDITQAYCDHPDPIYFIVLNIHELLSDLLHLSGVSEIELFGYYAGVNKSVRFPKEINEKVCSAHVLLKKGELAEKQVRISHTLPREFTCNMLMRKGL